MTSKKKNPWTQKELERLMRRYVDETGIQDFHYQEVSKWAKEKKYEMPVPQTDEELLAEMLGGAATKAKRRDEKSRLNYRALLFYPVRIAGEIKKRCFDADGPTATPEKVVASCQLRREQALNIIVAAKSSYEHHARTHPKEEMPVVDFSISDEEVQWRMKGRGLADDNDPQQKTG